MLGVGTDAIVTYRSPNVQMNVRALASQIARIALPASFRYASLRQQATSIPVQSIRHAIADVCADAGVWLHIDGWYGALAARSPHVGDAMRAIGRADSMSLDPHKWLFAPTDAGCLLVRDAASLQRAFSTGAGYIDAIADQDMSEFAYWDHSPELSRRFRALKIWFLLKVHGARAVPGSHRRQHCRGAAPRERR